MTFKIFIVSVFVASVQAQYFWTIPCRSEDQCASILGSGQIYRCSQGFCLCANLTTQTFEMCSNKDMILTAKATGLRRNCTQHEDCDVVAGANCLPKDPKDKSSKICLCRSDMVESKDGQKCLAVASEPGATCEESRQCAAGLNDGAECREGHCRCDADHHYGSSGRCVRNLAHGEHCKIDEGGCYQTNVPGGENLLTCSEHYGCKCKKRWNYNRKEGRCEYSSASRTIIQLSTISALILSLAFF